MPLQNDERERVLSAIDAAEFALDDLRGAVETETQAIPVMLKAINAGMRALIAIVSATSEAAD